MDILGIKYYPILESFSNSNKLHYYEYIKEYLSHKKVCKEMKLMSYQKYRAHEIELLRKSNIGKGVKV